jgi:hypothetical protein
VEHAGERRIVHEGSCLDGEVCEGKAAEEHK